MVVEGAQCEKIEMVMKLVVYIILLALGICF